MEDRHHLTFEAYEVGKLTLAKVPARIAANRFLKDAANRMPRVNETAKQKGSTRT
jgi:hypothetical protein